MKNFFITLGPGYVKTKKVASDLAPAQANLSLRPVIHAGGYGISL